MKKKILLLNCLIALLLHSCTFENEIIGKSAVISKTVININSIEGYVYPLSYNISDSIQFKIHSLDSIFDVNISRVNSDNILFKKSGVLVKQQNYTDSSFIKGCDWNTTLSFYIPKSYKSDYYVATISDNKDTNQIVFFVKPNQLESEILIISSTNTWQAYNTWGGGSFYEPSIFDAGRNYSYQVSFNRPISRGYVESPHLFKGETYFLKWLKSKNFQYDVICDEDLHNNFNLNNYKVVALHVHPEYWSKQMRDNLKKYMNNGGNLMYLGGNGIYWKVQLDDGVLECRKDSSSHTLEDNKRGGMWRNLQADESKILGVRYNAVGYNTYAPFMVYAEDTSWLLQGTSLKKGSIFGDSEIEGYASGRETDKMTEFTPDNAIIIAKGLNREAIHLLGRKGFETNGGADMIYFETEGGGAVFSVGSLTFTGGLMIDSNLSILTKNILDSMLKQ